MIYRHYRHDSVAINTYILHTHHSILHHSTFAKLLLERKTKRCGSDSRYVKSQSMPSWLQGATKYNLWDLWITPVHPHVNNVNIFCCHQAPSPAGAASWDLGVSEGAPNPPPDLRDARCAAPAWCGNRPGCAVGKRRWNHEWNRMNTLCLLDLDDFGPS